MGWSDRPNELGIYERLAKRHPETGFGAGNAALCGHGKRGRCVAFPFVVIRPIQMHWKQFYGMDCNGLEIHGIIAADGYYTLILSTGLRPCAMIPFTLRVHGIIAVNGYDTFVLSTGLSPCA